MNPWLRIVLAGIAALAATAMAGLLLIGALYLYLAPSLPPVERLKEVRYEIPLRVYSADRRLIAEYGDKKRIPVGYEAVPQSMIDAFLAAEDDRFFEHPGVDYQGILRAAWYLLLTGEKDQGGSTITMQVARNFFLSSEKTYIRKINEIFLALRIEHLLTKEEILELYLNKIYLGQRAYGVGAAAQVYYGRPVEELNLPQIAMIAGLPKAPSADNPLASEERARARRAYVLGRMRELGYIDEHTYQEARTAQLSADYHAATVEIDAPYVGEMVRAEMVDRFGKEAYTAGYEVYTTLRSELQRAAQGALREALLEYDRRHGYRGPLGRIDPARLSEPQPDDWAAMLEEYSTVGGLQPGVVVEVAERSATVRLGDGATATVPWEGLEWARAYQSRSSRGPEPETAADVVSVGDVVRVRAAGEDAWRLAQVPQVQGGLVALSPRDGAIQALRGGFDFDRSKFNRAVQARRQPGSAFKPFVYSAALAKGFTPASVINDAPVVFDDELLESAWRPENYSGRIHGPTRLREALVHSRNLVSIRLLRSIGIGYAVDYIQRFGFAPERLPRDLTLALGTAGLTPLELASGYAVFANSGYRVEPWLIERIVDAGGKVVYQARPRIVCASCEDAPDASATRVAAVGGEGVVDDGQGSAQAEDEPRLDEAVGADAEAGEAARQGPPSFEVAPRVLTPQNAYLMNTMLRDVIQRGTGRRARTLGRSDLSGKTGTTDDQRDAWFSGFNDRIVTTAWVGFDQRDALGPGETGARAALPMWIDFMRTALRGVPERSLERPSGLVTLRIDAETGDPTDAEDPDAIFETFRAEYAPRSSGGKSSKTGGGSTGNEASGVEPLF